MTEILDFFHAKASQRCKTNQIYCLKDPFGLRIEGKEQMVRLVESYFDDIFKTEIGEFEIDGATFDECETAFYA